MNAPILKTKLYIPLSRSDPSVGMGVSLVPRPRLIEQLNEGLRLGCRLTLISAPAGFGKTTLLSEWVHQCECPIAWFSIDEGDNDPVRFFNYLVAALQQIDATLGQAVQSLLGMPQLPPLEGLMTVLINDLTELPVPFGLVLDDYQLIHTASLHEAMAFLLEHQPPQMHLFVATRADPPLFLPRLRVRGQMTEIRADDLRFTAGEAAKFLDRALGLTLKDEIIAALESRTEGWVAGLQLAALSLRNKQNVAEFIGSFSGSHRHIIEYLAEEVLAQQPDERRQFLCQTAILDRFTAPLCDAVTGCQNSDVLLKQLEQANLFLIPLDEQGEWYRYHRLFADFLQTELDPQAAMLLHLKAAHWFEKQNLLSEAARHILAYAATSDDWDEALPILVGAIYQEFYNGAYVTVLGWLDVIPDSIVRTDSRLAGCKAASLIMTGHPEAGESYLRSAEQNLPIDAPPAYRGTLLGLRCYSEDVSEALRLSQEALDQIGTSDPLSRSNILFMLGDAQDAVGDVAGAIQSFEEAVQLGQQTNNQMVTAIAQGHLAISLNEQGKRSEALVLCQGGIERYVDTIGRPLPIACMFYVTLGTLEREANNLAQARQLIEQGLKLARQSAMTRLLMYALEELAHVEYALGEKDVAIKMIQEAQQIAIQGGERTSWVNTIAAVEADFDLQAGKISTMARWAETAEFATNPDPACKRQYPLYIRLLLAQKNLEEARTLLTQFERSAEEDQRYRQLITFYIQHALAEHLLGHEAESVSHLEQALRLAAPEGYSRAFIDEGRLVTDLLPKVRSIAPAFVDTLLGAFASEIEMAVSPLSEPLSEREVEILRLMAKDLTSPQIAEKLIVAVSTVRSHRKHIYHKLDAHSRYEAIERAKTLGLL